LSNHSQIKNQTASVKALAYANKENRLFVAGKFNALAGGTKLTSAGIVEWTQDGGLVALSGGGLIRYDNQIPEASALAYDADNKKLYVAGIFDAIGTQASECSTLAEYSPGSPARLVYHRKNFADDDTSFSNNYDASHFFKNISTNSTPLGYWKLEPNFGGSWKCVLPTTHRMDVQAAPVHLLLDSGSLYLAGRAAASSSWWTTANKSASAAIARYSRFFLESPAISDISSAQATNNKTDKRRERLYARKKRRLASAQRSYYAWEWLPGWRGLNGTILSLAAGMGSYDGCIFVGGEFGNEPPLVVWRHDDKLGPYTRRFFSIHGRVTAISMAIATKTILQKDTQTNSQDENNKKTSRGKRDRMILWRILRAACTSLGLACAALLILIFLARYANCGIKQIGLLPTIPNTKNGISLQMLSYGFAPDLDLEFSEAYEKAMKARHLDNINSLVMIDPAEIVLHDIIGEGSFGRVWSATWQTSAVAVKEFVLAQAAYAGGSIHRKDIIEEIVGEAGIMACLRHPKILQLYGCSLTAQAIWIVSELCTYGSLRQVLDDFSLQVPIELKLRMAIDIAEGMLYLHTRTPPIVHRDLKSHNLFVVDVNGSMQVRIGDWGSARAVAMSPNFSKTMTHGVGTTCWLAPELIKDAKGSERIDVYAFGIVLWELATREEVYAKLSATQIIHRVSNEGMRPPLPPSCPWNHVMEACWSENPAERPDSEQILAQLICIYEDVTGHELPPDGDNFVRLKFRIPSEEPRPEKESSIISTGGNQSDDENELAPRLYPQRRRNSDTAIRRSAETALRRGRSDPRHRAKAPKTHSRHRASSEHTPRRAVTPPLLSSTERDRLLGRKSLVPAHDHE